MSRVCSNVKAATQNGEAADVETHVHSHVDGSLTGATHVGQDARKLRIAMLAADLYGQGTCQ